MRSDPSDPYLAYLGANVRRLRIARGASQEQLAEAIGMDLRFLQRVETGLLNLRLKSIVRLAEQLDVTPGALLRKTKIPERKRGRPRKNARRPTR